MKNIEVRRIRWLCRRGMLELDLILLPFCEEKFNFLSKEDKLKFIEILKFEDNTLYNILVKNSSHPKHLSSLISEIKKYKTKDE